jgi:hypothetical protein
MILKLVFLLLLLPFMLFLPMGLIVLWRAVKLSRRVQLVPGEVIDWQTHNDAEGNVLYTPRVRFFSEGHAEEYLSSASSSRQPEIGDTVMVRYDPAAPHDRQEFSILWNVVFGVIAVVGGGIATFAAYLLATG